MERRHEADRADDMIRARMAGLVCTRGRGDARRYVEKAFGLKYDTYSRRLKYPGDLSLRDLRTITQACDMTDDEILMIFGRKGGRT